MKRWIALLILLPGLAVAAGSKVALQDPNIDLTDKASLQRGAQTFMNYCLGCHQMQYQRYQRMFNDLGIPEDLGQKYLQFTGESVSDYMTNTMPAEDSAQWFGAPPPDLTLVARVRGPEWLYTYFKTFYVDESKIFGVNNLVFPNVGMPHVLEPLQGTPRLAYEEKMVDGELVMRPAGLTNDGNGRLSEDEYNDTIRDLVNFLEYTGEPTRLKSESIGRGVLIFIVIFFVFALLLKKEYWRNVK
ncbi:ubiquinol-cytochrome c reductase cytochrome c1 subunit [Glaciecola punicea ACAM 611]|jgi:ubiquinol-cytochrome c reductase cytochrome c1 subunit|uniref:Ubiquinol-cytochrome c reductase cytochrome c1 subunit n=1 Tax=Glaciecola punicea ACAM 611 TaxID=1121923 RepID=H5TDA9_9ALTE|nr:cytochrome c1 [Glaciecola punicea]OFA30121.1 cytochrome C [Glaciecola punicea]GAB56286.1 ubiquinol-cytochrome c reductase cytochrome c1 subunit [Glaciecola punicea ACAM 611]